MTLKNRFQKLSPATLVLASFLLAILVGGSLLSLPFSTSAGSIRWIDALFTATSAVCVTGLTVVDTGTYFTAIGQAIILCLIQTGGIGVMTIAVVLFGWVGRRISFHQRMAMQDLFANKPREDILSLVKSIIVFTLSAEALGAALLCIRWTRELPFTAALYTSLFHAVSAFCNAGFSTFPDSMVRYRDDVLLNLTMSGLIVVGGIGFPVLYDLQQRLRLRGKSPMRLSIQTKTVLVTTLCLIVAGAAMFWLLESASSGASYPVQERILAATFQSITCRTAGFNTVDIAALNEATLLMMIFLMYFGASPGSCGGGVKTTTLALAVTFAVSRTQRKRRVNICRKSIPEETVTRSVSLMLMSAAIIVAVLFMLLIGDCVGDHNVPSYQHAGFLAYLFETVSAFGTVGLSMGMTADLSDWGKAWIMLMMLIGRVGVLTFSYIIAGNSATKGIEYSEENIMIG
ncbi:MAG: TrkH family potassium uptake protein [Desulfobacterales bacterium]|jgi:trk system potassium uptake protein TrkH|nr:TrkH family potassium uptake protein [Desulfobacterales bacterium]